MPCSANILFLVRFFTHLGNNRMRIDWLEKSVNVYLTPALGKFNVLVGCYILTTKKILRRNHKRPVVFRKIAGH